MIWSAATPPGVTQYVAAMRCVNQPVTFPATCPGATPVAPPRRNAWERLTLA